ncbi:actin binding Rho activating protein b [Megalops cyprinoides]|uniref:actin binding Rho activating protein b n=1 Tax=Megalops cyprinoides TaxID=118141 RepID=UPI001864C6E3|nr:actin binding Rho activating protein b [Megalops cyprinoides]
MADPRTDAVSRNPSANKNIRKLRAASMVCSLTRSWQRWVSENEEKQAGEPSGWSPDSDSRLERARTGPSEKRPRPNQSGTAVAPAPTGDASHHPGSQDSSLRDGKAQLGIKSKQVVKSVSSTAQEKGMGVGFLTSRYGREPDEVDRLLSKKASPTRRRKCSNLVSELTKGWKEVEREKQQKEAGGLEGGRAPSIDTEDSGFSEADDRSLDTDASSDTPDRTGHAVDRHMDKEKQRDSSKDMPEQTMESSLRIKRPSKAVNKDVDETKKLNTLAKKYSPVGNLKSKWQNWASEHEINQKLNPFSDEFDYELSMATRLHKGEEGYGRPKEGSKTAERAKRAEAHIHREIDDMCFIIRTMAEPGADGRTRVTFGELFDRYVRISDKVVGILMRARKHGKVAFEGEMLWQGQDDHVIITLLV